MTEKKENVDGYNYLTALYKKIPMNFKVCFIATYIIGLIAHAYCYFVPIFGHDAASLSHGGSIVEGAVGARWFQPIFLGLEEHCTLPWLIGIMTLLFYAVAAWCICELLRIERTVPIIMISGILVTSPNAICCNYYLSGAHAFAFALMTCLLSVYAFYKMRHGIAWSIFFLLLGAGTYVSYVDVAMAVFLILQIGILLENRKEDLQNIIKKHFQMLGIFGVGLLLTYLINWAIYTLAGETPQGRVSDAADILTGSDTQGGLPGLLIRVLKAMYHSIAAITPIRDYNHFQERPIYYGIFCIALAVTIIMMIYLIIKNKVWKNKLLFVLLLFDGICLLLAISFIDIFQIPHPLMTAAYVVPWLFMVQLYEVFYRIQGDELIGRRKAFLYSTIIILNSVVTIVEGCFLANTVYAMAYNNYMSGLMVMNRVAERVESVEGYEIGKTPVVMIGGFYPYDKAEYFTLLDGFYPTYDLIWYNSAVSEPFALDAFVQQHLRLDMNIMNVDTCNKNSAGESITEFAKQQGYEFDLAAYNELLQSGAMFPSTEAIKKCGDVIVVVLRDNSVAQE